MLPYEARDTCRIQICLRERYVIGNPAVLLMYGSQDALDHLAELI